MSKTTTTRILFLLGVVASLRNGIVADEVEDDGGNMKSLMKLVTECSRKEDIAICLKMRAFTVLDKLSRMRETVPINEYLALVWHPNSIDGNQNAEERSITELELETALPRSLDEKNVKLDEMLWDKVASLFSERTIQLTIPPSVFEGRGDKGGGGKGGKKGLGGIMMMAGMMMGMMMKLALAKIMLIAGKALIVAKISLVLSLIMILKKWAGGGGSHHAEVVYTSDHGGHRRSGREFDFAQELAYSGQKPDA